MSADTSSNHSDDAFPLMVRGLDPSEVSMVLANWKAELADERHRRGWGKGLRDQDYWRLANHAIDVISFPQSTVHVGVHPDNPTVPLIWMAVRDGVMLFSYARRSLRSDRELVERIESTMLQRLPGGVVAIRIHDFDPFRELERFKPCA